MFNPLCVIVHLRHSFCLSLLQTQHTTRHAPNMIFADQPRQMAHRIFVGQWHCSFDHKTQTLASSPISSPAVTLWSDHMSPLLHLHVLAPVTQGDQFISAGACFYWLKIRVLNEIGSSHFLEHRHICFLACSDVFIWFVGEGLMLLFVVILIHCVWHKTLWIL